MRVPAAVVVAVAVAFKIWLWWRTLPLAAHHIICIVALWFFVAIMAAIWMQRTEEKRGYEFICSDPAQRRMDYDYELCEYKLRSVSRASRPQEGLIA
jgi:hypothetical protein